MSIYFYFLNKITYNNRIYFFIPRSHASRGNAVRTLRVPIEQCPHVTGREASRRHSHAKRGNETAEIADTAEYLISLFSPRSHAFPRSHASRGNAGADALRPDSVRCPGRKASEAFRAKRGNETAEIADTAGGLFHLLI